MARPAGTATQILQLLRDGPLTAQALAAQLGLDVSSVRRHVDALVERGWLAFDDLRDGPGRPRRHYALTDSGWESFPRDYAFLLGTLLERLQRRMGRDAVLATFADLAVEMAAAAPPDQPVATRLEALRQLYLDLGFEPEMEHHGPSAQIIQRNCPFLRTAKADPEAMCDCLDEGIMRAALPEASIRLTQCMATGDSLCRHDILLEAP